MLVKAIIGKKLIAQIGTATKEIEDWHKLIKSGDLMQIETAPITNKVKYGFFEAFLNRYNLLLHASKINSQNGVFEPIPNDINPIIKNALIQTGITKLYSHQIDAWKAYTESKDIALLTQTSSGKSLAFLIPALHECLNNNSVLIFFNLKGLALDQSRKIKDIVKHIPVEYRPKILNINGDTPRKERLQQYVNTPTIILATPDAWNHDLEASKGNNFQLIQTLLNIKLVVIDEMHLYNGTFGAHFSWLNKRTQLKVDMLGGQPDSIKYIFASATIGNPKLVASLISNRSQDNLAVIESSGAKSFEKQFVCLKNSKTSTQHAAICLAKLIELDVTTICFTISKAQSKAIAAKIRQILINKGRNDLANKCSCFYGSMKPAQRSKIINGLLKGKIKGIVSTSALEAGVDISGIEATIICKYPGTILSARQQMGRAGRHKEGLIVFIPSSYSVIDGYYADNPNKLFTDKAEIVSFNQNYESIITNHLIAAAIESKPTVEIIEKYFGIAGLEIMHKLLNEEKLLPSFNNRIQANLNLGYYHSNIKMRGDSSNVQYINQETGEEFESSSTSIAIREVYKGAIYPAQDFDGQPVKYCVISLDLEEGKCILTPIDTNTNLYTVCKSELKISKIKQDKDESRNIKLDDTSSLIFNPIWGLIKESVSGYDLHNKEIRWTCNRKKCRNHHKKLHATYKTCPACGNLLRDIEVDEVVEQVIYPNPITVEYEAPAIEVSVSGNATNYFKIIVSNAKETIKENIRLGHCVMTKEVANVFTSEATQLVVHTIAHQIMLALPSVKHETNSKDIEFGLTKNSKPIIGYFFDTTAEGTGACQTLIAYWDLIVEKANLLVNSCDCKHGCNKCTIIHQCPDDNEYLFKDLGVKLLHNA
ncbi:DEAD/DEAH box helicase-like (plasmid) [Calothrix sp. PCC 7716]|nr:DEAD/DEAH box helicase-like [Calothrix sp. PCC 7716]